MAVETVPSSSRSSTSVHTRNRRQSAFPSVFSVLQRGQLFRLANWTTCCLDIIDPLPPIYRAETKRPGSTRPLNTAHVSVRRIVPDMRRIVAWLAAAAALACAHAPASPSSSFILRSPSFAEGERMPDDTMLNALDCHGPNVSPALSWEHAPA